MHFDNHTPIDEAKVEKSFKNAATKLLQDGLSNDSQQSE